MVINESFAARYFAGDPLDVKLRVPFHDRGDLTTPHHWWRIVGVVADVKNGAAGEPSRPEVFGTFNQFDTESQASMYLAVRTAADPTALAADLRTIVSSASVPAAIDQVMTMEARLARTLTRPRLSARSS